MILLNKNNLRIVSFCAKKESRFTLSAIRVSAKGTCVTDGHQLVMVSLPVDCKAESFPTVSTMPVGDGKEEGLLPRDFVAKLEKRIPVKQPIPILNNVGLTFDGAEGSVHAVVTDLNTSEVLLSKMFAGNFPNVEAVIPAENKIPVFEFSVSADCLLELARSAGLHMGDAQTPAVKLKFYSEDSAMRMDCRNTEGQTWTAVLMPLRDTPTEGYTGIARRLETETAERLEVAG